MASWYAIYTKVKCEETVASLLNQAGMETLNPKIRIRKFWRGRYRDSVEQLFPGYLFACFDEEEEGHLARYTRGVRYVVGKESPLIVPPRIITAIRERMEDGVVTPVCEEFRKGERVLIREGPFKDFYGVFERNMPGRQRAMILLDTLYFRLEVESRSLGKMEQKKTGGIKEGRQETR
ncbi:MAG: hypothetical protein M0Z60_00475 [Nitrospiraceae bacterium]|nr:hypothetical protein [Nitrospiraceae bacterium]